MVPQDGIELSRYRARRSMKELGFVSCQLPKYAYKKASQLHNGGLPPNKAEAKCDLVSNIVAKFT